MYAVEWMIALRYLLTRSRENFVSVITAFSLLGITLGVATLIIVMAVMNGYEVELINRILGLNGHITLSSPTRNITQYEELAAGVRQIPGVKFAAPMVQAQVMAISGSSSSGAMVRAMSPADLANKPLLASALQSGAWQDMELPILDDSGIPTGKIEAGIIVGKTFAETLELSLGSQVKLLASELDTTVVGNIPRMKTYRVVGIFDVGMYEYNAGMIFMPLAAAQSFFRYPQAVSDIEIMAYSVKDISQIKANLPSTQPLRVVDWMISNQNLVHALKVERNVMFLILTLIILVAAFNTISGLVMLVKEKTKSIAILRTFGMTRGAIIRIFMLTGSLIGIIGTMSGVLLGIAITLNLERIKKVLESLTGTPLFDPMIYFLTKLPADLQLRNVITIASLALVLSVISTIYPAWRASKLLPAEALRYE